MNDRLISLPHYSPTLSYRIRRTALQAVFALCAACCGLLSAQAATEFHVQEIRLEGLQRISAGTVFNYLPIKNGDLFDSKASKKAIEALFKTGLFNDIRLEQEGDILIIRMLERPAISKIAFNGNKELDTEELNKSLKTIGFAEGRVFDRSLLERVELELQRLYFSRGHYAARLTSTVTPQSRNRVNIQIDISEGKPATIHQINLVGNEAFSDGVLLDEFELSPSGLFSFFSSADQYSKQKLTADLENLRAFYLDRGYLNFSIDSTQVSITPNKQDIYLTINLTEGKKYTVAEVKILGNLILPEADLQKKLQIKPGDVFSRKQITASTEALTEALGDEGYAFANINTLPEPKVAGGDELVLSFFVDPGQRVYVRRINFEGNSKTRDEVLRREMRQMEGGWASTAKIKRSRTRLERLRFFDEVTVETPAVPDIADQIDVNYAVIERPSGNFLAGIGYSQTQGMLFNTSVTQDNFLGSGKRVSVAFNNSQVNTVYSFNYLDPYYTIDGISQSIGLYYRQTDAEQANLSRYALDAFGGSLTYGIPISENNSVFLGLEPEHLQVKTTENSAKEIFDYIDKYGDTFNTVKLTASWSHDTRDRAIFPESGMLQSLGAEAAVPIGDNLEYYKLNGKIAWYYPVFKNYVLMLDTELGYGESYGNTDFPFFENYTAGGPRSVRGFRENTLGPRDSNGNPIGGGFKLVGGAEFFLPMPFVKESRSVRLSAFVDIGNVYRTQADFDANTLRYSTGVSAIWLSPLGALSFSLAQPLNDEEGDDTQVFQFTLGATF